MSMKLLYSSVFFLLFSFSVSAQLTGINPNSGFATQNNLTTTITSAGLFQYAITQSGNIYEVHLEQGAGVNVLSIMDFGTGWWNGACTYVDPNTATLVFNIPGNQVTGVYDLVVTTTDVNFWGSNLQTFTLPACFTINPPDGYITGKIYFDANFNGNYDVGEAGLSNQVVILNPGSQTAYSNASGD